MTNNTLCRSCGSPAYDRADLCARMAPLNSYGLTGVGSALAEGLSALANVSRHALHALRQRAAE